MEDMWSKFPTFPRIPRGRSRLRRGLASVVLLKFNSGDDSWVWKHLIVSLRLIRFWKSDSKWSCRDWKDPRDAFFLKSEQKPFQNRRYGSTARATWRTNFDFLIHWTGIRVDSESEEKPRTQWAPWTSLCWSVMCVCVYFQSVAF